jgi:hypothetical protein
MLVNPAWNAGVGASSGHYVAVLNDDIIIYPKTFAKMKRQCDIHSVWCPYFTRADDKKVYQSNGENIVGFCFGFHREENRFPIPPTLKLWWGDNWLYHKHGKDIGWG